MLTIPEENAVVDACKSLAAMGFPIQYRMRRPIAGYVLRKRQLPSNVDIGVKRHSNVDIGVNWHIRFMERHPEVAYKHVQRLDEQRAQSTADPDVLKRFYQLIAHQVPAQLFNCDEKGIIIRTARTKGIVSAGGLRRRHYARGNSNRESATALETISAAGAVLPPLRSAKQSSCICIRMLASRHLPQNASNNPSKPLVYIHSMLGNGFHHPYEDQSQQSPLPRYVKSRMWWHW